MQMNIVIFANSHPAFLHVFRSYFLHDHEVAYISLNRTTFLNQHTHEKGLRGEFKDVRAQKVHTHRFFLNLPRRKVMINYCQKGKKKNGVTDFVLERTCPVKYLKSEKSGIVSW